jgi:hypothetical protein
LIRLVGITGCLVFSGCRAGTCEPGFGGQLVDAGRGSDGTVTAIVDLENGCPGSVCGQVHWVLPNAADGGSCSPPGTAVVDLAWNQVCDIGEVAVGSGSPIPSDAGVLMLILYELTALPDASVNCVGHDGLVPSP